ncbi:MAG: hypothetical protein V1900_03385 [Candidatus Aenigmatarchaeota archaeon]
MAKKTKSKRSRLTAEEIHLDKHDEEKVLLFTAGILFGIGSAVTVLKNPFWYTGMVAVVIAAILIFVEKRQEFR